MILLQCDYRINDPVIGRDIIDQKSSTSNTKQIFFHLSSFHLFRSSTMLLKMKWRHPSQSELTLYKIQSELTDFGLEASNYRL